MISSAVSFSRRRRSVVVAALVLSALVGCAEPEDVKVYTVDRTLEDERRAIVFGKRAETPAENPPPRAKEVPGRLIGVQLPHADEMWFFKLLGPDEAVKKHVDAVKTFVAAVKFEKNEPVWTVPAGWKEVPATDGVTHTFFVLDEADPKLRLGISRFPGQQDLAANVNRWRKQLKLSEVDAAEAAKAAVPLETAAGKALWVELTGTFSEQSRMPPFAGGMGMPGAGAADPKGGALPAGHPPIGAGPVAAGPASGPVAAAPFKYDLPAGWTPVPPSQFNLAAFNIADGDLKGRVTVSEAQGDLLLNVNRWRGQLGMPPTDEDQLQNALTKLKVAGLDADFIELIAPAGAGEQGAILGVVAKKSADTSVFIKFTGGAPLAQRERERFMQFVGSIRFDR